MIPQALRPPWKAVIIDEVAQRVQLSMTYPRIGLKKNRSEPPGNRLRLENPIFQIIANTGRIWLGNTKVYSKMVSFMEFRKYISLSYNNLKPENAGSEAGEYISTSECYHQHAIAPTTPSCYCEGSSGYRRSLPNWILSIVPLSNRSSLFWHCRHRETRTTP